MQGFHFIQSLHENRHTIEKVVYSLLYGLANVSLPNGIAAALIGGANGAALLSAVAMRHLETKSESCWPATFVRTKNVDTPIHAVTFRTVLYLIPRCGQQVWHRTRSWYHFRGRYHS
jgi:hypothetical protein